MTWKPELGAWPGEQGTRFRVWAPEAKSVEVKLERGNADSSVHPLHKERDGTFSGLISGVQVGDRYRYFVDGQGPFPDPASRFQPDGVHGPSEIVDATSFAWTDAKWHGIRLEDVVLYELHVGAFTPEGTFAAVAARLPYLKELGVTAVELMPVGDFPGRWNWGYDGVSLFAPARCYGRPDDLRRLVDTAHALGLAVLLDVVYNHLGPDGNYLGVFSPYYFNDKHQTGWGAALNFDGEHCEQVRRFFLENALRWIHEYHFDGLRLDATHAIADDSEPHFLAELAEKVHAAVPGKSLLVTAEDHRNLSGMLRTARESGWAIDAVWADDFHHQVRRQLAGDSEGYYGDYTGTVEDLATTIRQGWFYCGQHSAHLGELRGTDPAGIPPRRFVHCIQNHDQIGNRAMGERLNHQVDLPAFRAATVLLLCSPATPLLFMGQEWGASTPFQFFTDHNAGLGALVTEGRRREFRHFSTFSDPAAQSRIPDPQAPSTFAASRLNWTERTLEPHAALERLHAELLRLRQSEPALRSSTRESFDVAAFGDASLVLVRRADAGAALLVVVHLKGEATVDLRAHPLLAGLGRGWRMLLTTEDPLFSADVSPPSIEPVDNGVTIQFVRPGAVVLRALADADDRRSSTTVEGSRNP